MKTISCLRDLGDYGFNVLTGEACSLGLRWLVDLDERGLSIFCRAYGLTTPTECQDSSVFPAAWNSGGVASVMISPDDWGTLAILALLDREEVSCVWQCESGSGQIYYGLDEQVEVLRDEGHDEETILPINGTYKVWIPNWVISDPLDLDSEDKPWPVLSYGIPKRRFSFEDSGGPNDGSGRNVHASSGRTT